MIRLIAILAEGLLRRALTTLPPDLRARYEQEWRADLAELVDRPFATLSWALGLRGASRRLRAQAGRPRHWPVTRSALPRVALDALALGAAYYAAFTLRFGSALPDAYRTLFANTLPAVIVGGLITFAAVGLYTADRVGPVKVSKGVILASLLPLAYVAIVQPVLIVSAQGLMPLNVPAGVCVIFALALWALMACTRSGLALVRAVRA